MKLLTGKFYYLLILFAVFVYLGCEDSTSNNSNSGSLIVRITDGPFPIDLVEEANVTISKIEIRRENENDGNPFIVVSEDTVSYNLVTLRNGITEDLPEIDIPVGSYNLVRLYVADASILLTNGQKFDLTIPSGTQTGIKIFIEPAITVEGGLTAELILDFDLGRSFAVQGNPDTPAGINGFHFKPVIRAVNNSKAGRLAGKVTDISSAALVSAEVWVEQDSVISHTYSDKQGNFALIGLPAGTYSAFACKTDYDTVLVDNIKITAGNKMTQNFILTLTNF